MSSQRQRERFALVDTRVRRQATEVQVDGSDDPIQAARESSWRPAAEQARDGPERREELLHFTAPRVADATPVVYRRPVMDRTSARRPVDVWLTTISNRNG